MNPSITSLSDTFIYYNTYEMNEEFAAQIFSVFRFAQLFKIRTGFGRLRVGPYPVKARVLGYDLFIEVP